MKPLYDDIYLFLDNLEIVKSHYRIQSEKNLYYSYQIELIDGTVKQFDIDQTLPNHTLTITFKNNILVIINEYYSKQLRKI